MIKVEVLHDCKTPKVYPTHYEKFWYKAHWYSKKVLSYRPIYSTEQVNWTCPECGTEWACNAFSFYEYEHRHSKPEWTRCRIKPLFEEVDESTLDKQSDGTYTSS